MESSGKFEGREKLPRYQNEISQDKSISRGNWERKAKAEAIRKTTPICKTPYLRFL